MGARTAGAAARRRRSGGTPPTGRPAGKGQHGARTQENTRERQGNTARRQTLTCKKQHFGNNYCAF